ncbi:DUF5675 family protein [Negadavirga shengliensis]|uniref:DUF5675 family protein n=1 Tax=Negadavirga shengliensis TaxID=1389218 RepID=A0ABV9SZT2_9BACT
MKRLLGLLAIALIAVLILLLVTNPEILNKVWMWLIGFAGYVYLLIEKGVEALKSPFQAKPDVTPKKTGPQVPGPIPGPEKPRSLEDHVEKIEGLLRKGAVKDTPLSQQEVTVLRYMDDGETTLGLLFLQNKFFAYTLEDTHQDEKIAGSTRIPQGIYPLILNRNLTDLTQRYRNQFQWFDFHIELKDVPDFSNVYIHIGNSHQDTRGCILIADGVTAAGTEKMITHSRIAFERFYKTLYPKLKHNEKMEIRILDENWFQKARIQTENESIST